MQFPSSDDGQAGTSGQTKSNCSSLETSLAEIGPLGIAMAARTAASTSGSANTIGPAQPVLELPALPPPEPPPPAVEPASPPEPEPAEASLLELPPGDDDAPAAPPEAARPPEPVLASELPAVEEPPFAGTCVLVAEQPRYGPINNAASSPAAVGAWPSFHDGLHGERNRTTLWCRQRPRTVQRLGLELTQFSATA